MRRPTLREQGVALRVSVMSRRKIMERGEAETLSRVLLAWEAMPKPDLAALHQVAAG